MKKGELLAYLKSKKDSKQIDLSGKDLEGIKSNLLNINKNEVLFKPGNTATSFFFIVSGEVMVNINDNVSVYNKKEYFGFEELVGIKKRKGKAIAAENSVVMEFIVYDNTIPKLQTESSISAQTHSKHPNTDKLVTEKLSITHNTSVDFDSAEREGLLIIFVNVEKATLTYSKSFLEHVNKEIEKGYKELIIDLRKCTIIDSTFLGSLVKSLRALTQVDGRIVLVYNKDSQSTLFMITYMDKVFETFDTLEEAIKYLKEN